MSEDLKCVIHPCNLESIRKICSNVWRRAWTDQCSPRLSSGSRCSSLDSKKGSRYGGINGSFMGINFFTVFVMEQSKARYYLTNLKIYFHSGDLHGYVPGRRLTTLKHLKNPMRTISQYRENGCWLWVVWDRRGIEINFEPKDRARGDLWVIYKYIGSSTTGLKGKS